MSGYVEDTGGSETGLESHAVVAAECVLGKKSFGEKMPNENATANQRAHKCWIPAAGRTVR